MTSADLLTATVLKLRKAVVYVRQSTQTQVETNLESQRRQYDLVDKARRRAFRDVEVSMTTSDARQAEQWRDLELCRLVGASVIDLDAVYDPCRPNDRLLLGMKGSVSEFELGVLRARMYDAARSKARRGEPRISVPVGYVWHRETGLGFDPVCGCRKRSMSSSHGSASWAAPGRFCCR